MLKTATVLACGLAASIFSFDAQAFPGSSVLQLAASDIVEVRDFCGLGFHRNPWRACVPNGTPYGYVAPVVVAPAVMVAPRVVCPYCYYLYAAYNRCVPRPL
jgi:hypothetical protein